VNSVRTSNVNKRAPAKGGTHLSVDLLVMAALIGVSRAVLGSAKSASRLAEQSRVLGYCLLKIELPASFSSC